MQKIWTKEEIINLLKERIRELRSLPQKVSDGSLPYEERAMIYLNEQTLKVNEKLLLKLAPNETDYLN